MPLANLSPIRRPSRAHPATRTLKCQGRPAFRSTAARDLSYLLDVDQEVKQWRCDAPALEISALSHRPDFLVTGKDGSKVFMDAPDRTLPATEAEIDAAARAMGRGYRRRTAEDLGPAFRVENARDLLRYANWTVPLAERIRILKFLDEETSVPLGECVCAFCHRDAVAFIASMFCRGLVDIDLDSAPIGPDTSVRRI